jgi:hypothetical protein
MQGAPISSLVAETINSKIMACVPAEACLVNFADNYQALGRTRQEAELALKALKPAVERCPAGRFKLIHKKVRRLDHGIEFLGYRFKANRYGVSIKPAKAKEQEFYQKVRDLIRSSDSEVKKAAALKTLLMSWSSAYELCPSIEYDVMTTLRDRYAKRPHVWRLLRPGWTALCRRARARFERGAEILERQPTNFRSSVLTSK